ncbi:MAG: nitrate reductase [Wenzhouxiangellaceae bacterium]|nr:nitrate reductase [Wenzhouxiangellaceae bacterium]
MPILDFARGPMLHFALIVFVFGVLWRLVTVFLLGYRKHYSEARNSAAKSMTGAAVAVGSRSWPHPEFIPRTGFGEAVGYGYHIGLFAIVLLGTPHVEFWQNLFGFSAPYWPTLPTGFINVISVLTIGLMLIATIRRVTNPVLRRISNFDDYFSLVILYALMISGVMAVFGIGGRYEYVLAAHIISFNLLLIWYPFSKLMHAFYIFPTRFIQGYLHSRKGAAS